MVKSGKGSGAVRKAKFQKSSLTFSVQTALQMKSKQESATATQCT